MGRVSLAIIVIGVLFLASCVTETTQSPCEPPYMRIGIDCCLDSDDDSVCDAHETAPCESPYARVGERCCLDANRNAQCDDEVTQVPKTDATKPTTKEQPEAAPVQQEAPPIVVAQDREPSQYGLHVRDSMHEYLKRKYFYTEKTFGVQELHYEGTLPIISSQNYMEFQVFNIVLTPEPWVDFSLQSFDHGVESPGALHVGESYVTKSGVKITIDAITTGLVNFTLEKVPESDHTVLCPDCLRSSVIVDDDGLRFINLNDAYIVYVGPTEYEVTMEGLHRQEQLASLRVVPRDGTTETVPYLANGQEFILRDGNALRMIYAAAHSWGGSDTYGYAVYGFVATQGLPLNMRCPHCTSWYNLRDGMSDTLLAGGKSYETSVMMQGAKVMLTIDGETLALARDKTVEFKDLGVVLFETSPLIQMGIISSDESPAQLYCRKLGDLDNSPSKKGYITYAVGSRDQSFERADHCEDANTLVEYSCYKLPKWISKAEGDTGKGYNANVTRMSCDCVDGECV